MVIMQKIYNYWSTINVSWVRRCSRNGDDVFDRTNVKI